MSFRKNASARVAAPVMFALLASISIASVPAAAAVLEAQVNRLGIDLTPVGAEKAGEGEIPEWTGGLSSVPSNVTYEPGKHLQDPFSSDPVRYTVTGENAGQYADILTTGQRAMLDRYDSYKMNVYETRRSCAYPEAVYQATKHNAEVGELVGGGNGVGKAIMGFPFPIPNSAYEIVWNHTLRYRSFKLTRQFAAAPMTPSGDYTLLKVQDEAIFWWSDPSKGSAEELDNNSIFYIANTIAPARAAGNVILVHEAVNAAVRPRQAWQYSPGTRRVRRAPNIAFDNPGVNTDGLSTADSFDGYNGSLERYDWTVNGKSPRLIAANAYQTLDVPYEQLLTPLHVNQDLVRYELHRVWEIDALLRSNTRHVYSRRTLYLDEDSWQITGSALYDGRGEIWRVQEIQQMASYQVPLCGYNGQIDYDLQASRYLAAGLQNEEPPVNFFADELDGERYTPSAIRRMGAR